MKYILTILLMATTLMTAAQTKIQLETGGRTMTATLADNEAAATLASMLSDGPVQVEMDDYGGFEKVGELPQPLPASDSHITARAGDIMLYLGRNMVVFYGSNSWSYTRLGTIDGATADGLREFLGSGSVTLTLSAVSASGIRDTGADKRHAAAAHDLKGMRADSRRQSAAVNIVDGKKRIVR